MHYLCSDIERHTVDIDTDEVVWLRDCFYFSVKSCVELMKACEELSLKSEETSHSAASPAKNTAPNKDSPAGLSCRDTIINQRNNPCKRKRDADAAEDRYEMCDLPLLQNGKSSIFYMLRVQCFCKHEWC